MAEQLKTLFTELVKFTKTVSPEIWAILVKQQIIWGISSLLFLILAIGVFLYGVHLRKTRPAWAIIDNDNVLGGIFFGVGLLFSAIALGVFLIEGLPNLINPEYHALMSLKP